MSKRKHFFSIISIMIALCVLFLFQNTDDIFAAQQKTSLTITDAEKSMTFRLYQLQTRAENGQMTVTSAFAGYALDWELDSSQKMSEMATTLTAYIMQDHPTPYATDTAGEDGIVRFADLPQGLYLALGVETDQTLTSPVIVYLPYTDQDGNLVYDAKAEAKLGNKPKYKNISVCKIWKDDNDTNRPESISVNLLMDHKIFKNVTLSKKNNWQYTWYDLDDSHIYRVTEVVPKGYTVRITEDANAFTITNTKPGNPKKPSKTPPKKSPKKPNRKLPKTGQLWWPVGILAEVGLILCILGVLLMRRRRKMN